MENKTATHPGIYQTIPHNVAKQRYKECRECNRGVSPVFVLWWYMEETTPPDGQRVGHLHHDYIEFEEWLQVRNLAA